MTPVIYNGGRRPMRTRERPRDFAVALAIAAVALAIRALLQPWLGPLQPFAPGFVAIAASVLFCGWRPAVLTAVASYVGGTVLFVQGRSDIFSARPQDLAPMITYGLSAALMIFMGHRARRAERQIAEANEQLRAADRKKDEFLATLSHELRNPISVISAAVGVLDAHVKEGPARSAVAVLSRQSTQIQRLVSDLLDIGRITRGRMTLHIETVDVRSSIEHAVESCRSAVSRKQQLLLHDIPDHPVPLQIDHGRIVQVVSNLIDNASKYSPEHAEVRVALYEDAVDAVIDVIDNGPGIDPLVLPHVFDIFDQSGVSQSDGLGLGLGLCKRIVDLHGGTIAAECNPQGAGARFVIRLPKTQDDTNGDTRHAQAVANGNSV